MNSPSPKLDEADLGRETTATESPVVVIQYRDRGLPMWLLMAIVLVVPLAVILMYHQLVVMKYRNEASNEFASAHTTNDGLNTEEPITIEPAIPEPLALNSQPILPGTIEPPLSAPPTTTSVSLINTGYPRTDEGARAAIPAESARAPAVRTDPDQATPNGAAKINDVQSAAAPGITSGTSVISIAASIPPPVQTPPVQTPMDRIDPPTAAAPISPITDDRSSTDAGLSVSGDPDDATDAKPLPTKEESNRLLEEEAKKKEAEIDGLEARQQSAVREMKQKERTSFRAELEEILQTHGTRAGIEIDKLAKRSGYDTTSEQFLKAWDMWRFSRLSTAVKVRYIRSLGVPEVAILNFLSDLFGVRVGMRDGPRDRNEVRIRAARALLSYKLPATDARGPVDMKEPPNGGQGVPRARAPGAGASAAGVSRRSR